MATPTLAHPKKPLVYSIDDDKDLNQLMEMRFTKFGCTIRTFTDPKDLFNAIQLATPQLLLVDLELNSALNGFHVIEKIRRDMNLKFPILIISGKTSNELVAHALEIGADDYVVKPPFKYQFEEKVAEYIRAENLPAATVSAFTPVPSYAKEALIRFDFKITEVTPLGFTLISRHLIKKGCVLRLSGDFVKKIVPSVDTVFVTVLGSSAVLIGESRAFQLKVEVDPGNEPVVADLRVFLDSVRPKEDKKKLP